MTVNEINLGAYTNGAGQGRSTFANRMKDEYVPAWEDYVHTGRVIAKYMAPKRGTMGGKRSLTSVMDSYPASFGIALFEGDDMPTPRTPTYFQPELMSRSIYGRLRWTGHVIDAAKKGDPVAWAKPAVEDLKVARIQFELNFCRMLYLGPHQILATASGAATVGVIPLYGRDARTSQNDDRHKYGSFYLRKGMSLSHVAASGGAVVPGGSLVDSAITSGGAYQNEFYLGAVDGPAAASPTATTFDSSGAAADFTTDVADESILVPFRSRVDAPGSDDADADSNFAGINGLMNLVANASRKTFVYGQSRSTYPMLEAFVDTNGTNGVRPFDEDRIAYAADKINDDGTGDDPDVIICHRSVRREYVKETKGDRRFEAVQTKKGYAKLVFSAGDVMLPIQTDRDCMPGLMWILESDGFGWMSEADLQMVGDGERFVVNKDAHETIFKKRGNVLHRKPHNNCLVDDIEYSTSGLTEIA